MTLVHVPPPVCGHPSIAAGLDIQPYLETPRSSFVGRDFAYMAIVVTAGVLHASHAKTRPLGRVIDTFLAVLFVYSVWYKEQMDRSNWGDVCAAWSTDRRQMKWFLYCCIASWISSIVLDLKTCMHILKLQYNPQRKKFRPFQRMVNIMILFFVVNAIFVVGEYMYSDLRTSMHITSDPWIFTFFGLAGIGRGLSIGLQGCIVSRALFSQRWRFPRDDARRLPMRGIWIFNVAMLVNTAQCILNGYYHSSFDFLQLFFLLLSRLAIVVWSLINTIMNNQTLMDYVLRLRRPLDRRILRPLRMFWRFVTLCIMIGQVPEDGADDNIHPAPANEDRLPQLPDDLQPPPLQPVADHELLPPPFDVPRGQEPGVPVDEERLRVPRLPDDLQPPPLQPAVAADHELLPPPFDEPRGQEQGVPVDEERLRVPQLPDDLQPPPLQPAVVANRELLPPPFDVPRGQEQGVPVGEERLRVPRLPGNNLPPLLEPDDELDRLPPAFGVPCEREQGGAWGTPVTGIELQEILGYQARNKTRLVT